MSRRPANPRYDRDIFSNTADRTKLVNLSGNPMRGGTRL